jgi:uncharacterized protein
MDVRRSAQCLGTMLGELKKALLNRLMAAEFEHHLAQDRPSGEGKNHRNDSTRKRVLTDDSHVEVTILNSGVRKRVQPRHLSPSVLQLTQLISSGLQPAVLTTAALHEIARDNACRFIQIVLTNPSMYEWDDAKNAINIARHGVSFTLAQRIFDGPVPTVRDQRKDYGEPCEVSIGMADDIAILTVVHTDRRGKVRIISAPAASARERRRYEEAIR